MWLYKINVGCFVAITLMTVQDTPSKVSVSAAAPIFTLKNVNSESRSLIAYRGRPVTLFFFCGCSWCSEVAKRWGQEQRNSVLTFFRPAHTPPVTLVVFSGSGEEAQEFARQNGLDTKQSDLLPDPTMRVVRQYAAQSCPRVFVVDAKGYICYTNNYSDGASHKATVAATVAHTLDALQKCSAKLSVPKPKLLRHSSKKR